jgi:hypothetical protein
MTAILLGLLVASAKSFYHTQNNELTEMSAKIILLDRLQAHCGPEAKDARDVLHAARCRFQPRSSWFWRCIALSVEWFRSPALRCAALSCISKNNGR